jgi:hypothetical protein
MRQVNCETWCLCECVNEITVEKASYGIIYHRGYITQPPTTIGIPKPLHHPNKPSATYPDPPVFALRCKQESQPTFSRSKNLDYTQSSIPSHVNPRIAGNWFQTAGTLQRELQPRVKVTTWTVIISNMRCMWVIPKEDIQKCFQQWQEHWNKCMCVGWKYFEEG